MQRRYLITGAQGFVGRYLTSRILDLDESSQVLGIGRSSRVDGFFTHTISMGCGQGCAPLPPDLNASFGERYRYQDVSLLDTVRLREILRAFQPQCIFHLAAALSTAPDRDLIETNLQGTASLMDATTEALHARPLVILGSSGSVYGNAPSVPLSESEACEPADMYGLTKLAAEHIARVKATRGGLGFITARIFNVVGPGQAESHVCGQLAAQVAALSETTGGILRVGDMDTTRDFIDVRDLAASLLLLAQKGESGGTYNLASGHETPIHVVFAELLRIAGRVGQSTMIQRSDRPAGVRRHFADVSRLQALGISAKYSLSDSLHDVLRYYRNLRRSDSGQRDAS